MVFHPEVEVTKAFCEGVAVVSGAGGPVGGGDAGGELPAKGISVGDGSFHGGIGGGCSQGAFLAGFDDLGR